MSETVNQAYEFCNRISQRGVLTTLNPIEEWCVFHEDELDEKDIYLDIKEQYRPSRYHSNIQRIVLSDAGVLHPVNALQYPLAVDDGLIEDCIYNLTHQDTARDPYADVVTYLKGADGSTLVKWFVQIKNHLTPETSKQLIQVLSEVTQPNVELSAEETGTGLENTIDRAIKLDQRGNTDAALDLLYDTVDDQMRKGRFDDLSNIFASANADTLSVDVILGLLTATLPARCRISERTNFFDKAKHSLAKRGLLTDDLLVGLE